MTEESTSCGFGMGREVFRGYDDHHVPTVILYSILPNVSYPLPVSSASVTVKLVARSE